MASRWCRSWAALGMLLLVMVPVVGVLAQDDAFPAIELMQTATGTIDDEAPVLQWAFEPAVAGNYTFVAWANSDLDPYLQILDADGDVLAESDDIVYPQDLNAAIEGIPLSAGETYTVLVTRYGFEVGVSSGDFILAVLPAFGYPLLWEDFSGGRVWSAEGTELAAVELQSEQLQLTVNVENALVWAAPEDAVQLPLRAYVQARASVENDPDYWEYGLVFRQSGPTNYYLFAVSSRGDWAFLARSGASSWQTIQDWTEHSLLSAAPSETVLGVVMDGDSFTFYVNGNELDTLTADIHNGPGGIALSAGTIEAQETLPVIRFDDVLATGALPASSAAAAETAAPIESWQNGNSTAVLEELAAQELVPEGGAQRMLVPESFITASQPGMNYLGLGQGRSQTDLVLSTTVVPDTESDENGCGVVFRRESDESYTVLFIDQAGGYGTAVWQNGEFDPAFYDIQPGLLDDGSVHLIVVVQGEGVQAFADGQPLFTQLVPAKNGSIGIMALNYDGAFINCQFRELWLWTWDE